MRRHEAVVVFLWDGKFTRVRNTRRIRYWRRTGKLAASMSTNIEKKRQPVKGHIIIDPCAYVRTDRHTSHIMSIISHTVAVISVER